MVIYLFLSTFNIGSAVSLCLVQTEFLQDLFYLEYYVSYGIKLTYNVIVSKCFLTLIFSVGLYEVDKLVMYTSAV